MTAAASSRLTAAKALVKCLELENITTVFGYPGAAICPFYDELSRSSIEHVLVRHEANAGHAASGMARISGKPAVCVATSGPGATNLITAIATAYMDSIPIVAITGQVCTDQIGKDVFQEADITGACESFVKHSFLIKDAASLPEMVRRAFYIAASGRPGPVLLDIPFDVQLTEIEFEYPETVDIRGYKPSCAGNKLQIKRVADAILEAQKPLIIAGGGCFCKNACALMRQMAQKADIPVINTMMGISSFPHDHPLYFGMLGMHGKPVANRAVNECDLLILLGARINDRAITALKETQAESLKIVHVDIDPAEIGKNLPASIPVVGDIYAVLEQILEILPEKKHTAWVEYLRGKAGAKDNKAVINSRSGCVCPKEFIQALNRLMPEDAVVCADVGQNQIWTANNIAVGKFITSGGMGTMGYSVPAAIGAKKAAPSREVIAICGDGSFQMQMMELATAVQHGINVKIIIMANGKLGMVRELQDMKYNGNTTAISLDGSPDFIKIADAYGIAGEYLTDIKNANQALIALLASKKPYVLQVSVDESLGAIL
jgi:acetolactate synthase-1/2/3 large subunit